MAKLNFVKSARKADPKHGIEIGDSYYWWQLYRQPKRKSKTRPPRSALTGSEFYATMYDIEDEIGALNCTDTDGLRDTVDDIAMRIREAGSECSERLENMPEGLQEGDAGQMLQERYDACEAWADELEGVDLDAPDPAEMRTQAVDDLGEAHEDDDPADREDDLKTLTADKVEEFWNERLEEIQSIQGEYP